MGGRRHGEASRASAPTAANSRRAQQGDDGDGHEHLVDPVATSTGDEHAEAPAAGTTRR